VGETDKVLLVADNPRIEQLLRRVRSDPASIAFAALAEEYRKEGRYAEAIEICRVGLQRHPAYLSARVTLGRALIGVGDLDAARLELESVLRVAPENLSAIRAMAEIYTQLRDAEVWPAADIDDEQPLPLSPQADTVRAVPEPAEPAPLPVVPAVEPQEPPPHPHQTAINRLERFLEAIVDARARLADQADGRGLAR
jgi:tetratricopeptide (TPR) repeat protein